MNSDPEGLFYSAIASDGSFRVGWLCREDRPTYDDLDAWHDALDVLRDPPGLKLVSMKRCRQSDMLRMFPGSI